MAATTEPETIYNCRRLIPNHNGGGYQNLNFVGDSHSSDFMRVLQETTYKHRVLPKSCEAIKDKYSLHLNFNKCND